MKMGIASNAMVHKNEWMIGYLMMDKDGDS
jgi:hypothetical protein